MNLHLQGFKQNEPTKKRFFQKQNFFTSSNPTGLYRIMWLTFLLSFLCAGACAQIKPVIPHINTNGGGTMLIVDGGGGGGGGGVGCNLPVFTTNLSTAPYYVILNGTAPVLTVSATNLTTLPGAPQYRWYQSTDANTWHVITGVTSASYTPPVNALGTIYYAVNAITECSTTTTSNMATVIVSAAETTPVAGTISGGTTVCTGTNNTTLSLSGYTGSIQWQSSTNNTNFTDIPGAISASYIAANLTATTWYRTVVSSGSTSAISSGVSITVNQKSSAPLAATADPSTICNGQSTILTYHGGSLGTNAVFNWYTDAACTSPAVATGQFPTVSPTVTTTYYGRYEDPAPCNSVTATTSVTVTVNQKSSAPLAATADPSTICNGQSTILTYHGGSLGTNAVFNWYTDAACTSPAVATGQFPTVSPTVTTTYYGRYEDPAPCNSVTATTSVTVTVNPNASAGTVTAGTSPQCIGSTTTYTVSGAILSGGTGSWGSSNTAVATVDPSTGVVTAINEGTCNIIYTVTGGCGGTQTASQPYTVNPNARVGTISGGTSPQCIGSSTTFTVGAVLSGGTGSWSSITPSIATVDPSSGLVTAVGGGTCSIFYTVTGGCGGTVFATHPYSVIASIDASANSNPVALGSTVSLSATILPAISGATVTFNLDPGTGIITPYTAVTNTSGVATTAPISDLSVNVYKVIATAAGCAVSNTAYLPVYDPNSSFVTGGGWIISPAGALVQPLLSGKANFGFVAKYQKGSSNVNGNTEFDFNDGDFNFASSSLNAGTLVISGAKATYRGVGTVNGTGNYGFVVTAVDGQINGGSGTDLFRIKIWDRSNGNTVVYDNDMDADENGVPTPTTALGGGSIVIHYAKNKTRVMNTDSNVEIVNNNLNQLIGTGKLTIKVMPNPSSYHFSLGLNSLSKENIKVIVTDITGRVIDIKTNVPANSTIQLGDNYQHGIYIAEFLQGNDKVTLRLIKEGR